jgi:hypothetical protein
MNDPYIVTFTPPKCKPGYSQIVNFDGGVMGSPRRKIDGASVTPEEAYEPESWKAYSEKMNRVVAKRKVFEGTN